MRRPWPLSSLAALTICAAVVALTNRSLSAALPWRYPAVTDMVVAMFAAA